MIQCSAGIDFRVAYYTKSIQTAPQFYEIFKTRNIEHIKIKGRKVDVKQKYTKCGRINKLI